MTNAREQTARLADLLRREHHAMADFLVALADFDRRRLWSELGYTGLFMFLHRELGLSKGASHYRKTAADLVQRVPAVIEPLRDGRLCITSVVELAKVLTPENRAELLPRFFHRSKREAMEIAAELRPDPAPAKRDVVTAVSLALPSASNAEPVKTAMPVQLANLPHANSPTAERVLMSRPDDRPDVTVPLTADLRRLHVTVSRRFLEKLEAARDAMSHSHPGAEIEEILEAGLDLVLAQHATRKGLVAKPREEPPPSKPDRIPAHVKRAVWIRDAGRCQFKLENGEVCGSTVRLEFDHIRPRALGGPSTVENVRLVCRPHNGLAARRVFGDAWMDRFTRRAHRGYSGAAASAHSRLMSTDPPASGWSPSASVSGRARNQT
jgi:hypothetical protein